jgi:hypothetical protein
VSDRSDAGPRGEKMHQEVLRLNGIIREMGEDAGVVMRERNVIDREFVEHNVAGVDGLGEGLFRFSAHGR